MNNPFERYLGRTMPDAEKQNEGPADLEEMQSLLAKVEGMVLASAIPPNQKEAVIQIIESINHEKLSLDADYLLKTKPYYRNKISAAMVLVSRELRSLRLDEAEYGNSTTLSRLIESINVDLTNESRQ